MESVKLYMALLGCKPPARNTEQHDVFFSIGNRLKDIVPEIFAFWPEANQKIHLDAWREVTQVGEYDVKVVRKENLLTTTLLEPKLFFINLGGYKPGEFEEYHYRMLVVAKDKAGAKQEATRTAFYMHAGFKGAPSHIDDQYGIDVDDLHEIPDILSPGVKHSYFLLVTPSKEYKPDEVHIGYMKPGNL